MTTYILLRSNKESGPFNLDQMAEMGLKADDLIWVEGQSASWRNPGEIKELRDLVKAQVQARPSEPAPAGPGEETTPVKEHISATPDKRSVFVSMPGSNSPVRGGQPGSSSPPVYKEPEAEPLQISSEEVETKYAMSLDEIKQRYVRSLEERKNRKRSVSLEIPENIRRIAVYAGVFILGAVIVLLLVRPDKTATVAGEQMKLPAKFETRPEEDVAASEPDPADEVMMPESYYDAQASTTSSEGKQTREAVPSRSVVVPAEKETAGVLDDTGEVLREEEPDHKITLPKNEKAEVVNISTAEISDQVSVKSNRYTIAALGGIRDLELTVRNSSGYKLDKVTVEVRYLNPKGDIVKTEDVEFRSIQANGVQTKGMKKSNRGVKVSYRIIHIESREAGSGTASSLKVN